jgi:hypothetical protein
MNLIFEYVRAGGMTEVLECSSANGKALSWNPSTSSSCPPQKRGNLSNHKQELERKGTIAVSVDKKYLRSQQPPEILSGVTS